LRGGTSRGRELAKSHSYERFRVKDEVNFELKMTISISKTDAELPPNFEKEAL
jgi:hypothetical protein